MLLELKQYLRQNKNKTYEQTHIEKKDFPCLWFNLYN